MNKQKDIDKPLSLTNQFFTDRVHMGYFISENLMIEGRGLA